MRITMAMKPTLFLMSAAIGLSTMSLVGSALRETPRASAAVTCDNAFKPIGYIGQKWSEFNGLSSALGCPTSAEHAYAPGLGAPGTAPEGSRQQEFEHGVIVYHPSLGPQMVFSAWYIGASKVHVGFTKVEQSRPRYRIGLSSGNGETYVDFSGGNGHNGDLGVSNSTAVRIRLLPCDSMSTESCAPHMKRSVTSVVVEDPRDGSIVPTINLSSNLAIGSDVGNVSLLPPPAPVDVAASYNVDLESLVANSIRSGNAFGKGSSSDTLYSFLAVKVGNEPVRTAGVWGPHDIGMHSSAAVGQSIGNITLHDADVIKISYSIINNGHQQASALSTAIEQAVSKQLGAIADEQVNGLLNGATAGNQDLSAAANAAKQALTGTQYANVVNSDAGSIAAQITQSRT